MSERSPYKEFGISAMARPRIIRPKQPHGFNERGQSMPTGHVWGSNLSDLKAPTKRLTACDRSAMRVCEKCGKPEFAVGDLPCSGRKKT
jgi:hypothetical protein